MAAITLDTPVVRSYEDTGIRISKFSALSRETQEVAFTAIGHLNHSISTEADTTDTWDKYTPTIIERLQERPNSKNTFFVAQDRTVSEREGIVGYVAFYTRKDRMPHLNSFIDGSQAYCSWTAVEESHRGKGLAISLKTEIFEPEHGVESFRGHVKKTNKPSLRVIDKFGELGHKTSKVHQSHQFLYTIHKKT